MIDAAAQLGSVVLDSHSAIPEQAAAALAVGLGALGTGYAQRGIGSAAIGAIAEDDDMFVPGLVFVAIPETLIIIAFVTLFIATGG